MRSAILALDRGTTSSPANVFDHSSNLCAVAQRKFRQSYPQSGWVEQIGRNTRYTIRPVEILADNFVRLINGDTHLPTPRFLAGMANAFRHRAAQP